MVYILNLNSSISDLQTFTSQQRNRRTFQLKRLMQPPVPVSWMVVLCFGALNWGCFWCFYQPCCFIVPPKVGWICLMLFIFLLGLALHLKTNKKGKKRPSVVFPSISQQRVFSRAFCEASIDCWSHETKPVRSRSPQKTKRNLALADPR